MKKEVFTSVGFASGGDKTSLSKDIPLKAFYPDSFFTMFPFFSVFDGFAVVVVHLPDSAMSVPTALQRTCEMCTPHTISMSSSSKKEKKLRADKIQTSIYLWPVVPCLPLPMSNTPYAKHILFFFLLFRLLLHGDGLWRCMLWVPAAATTVAGRHRSTWDVVYLFFLLLFEHIMHTCADRRARKTVAAATTVRLI